MDGKKKIARLRNAWNAMDIFKGPPMRVKKVINPKPLMCVGLDGPFVEIAGMPVIPDGHIVVQDRWGSPKIVKKSKSVFDCPYNFIAALQKKGYKHLGAGAYSTVLGKDGSDKVIKVSRMLDNWIDYVQWGVKEGYAGSFVPKVYSWKRRGKHTDAYDRQGEWSVAVVERMEKTLDDRKVDMALVLDLQYAANNGNIMAKLYMEDLCPGAATFFQALSDNDFNGDVFGKNVMVRKDGTMCVTDPCAGSIRTTSKRFKTGALSPVIWIYIENSNRYRSERFTQPYEDLVYHM